MNRTKSILNFLVVIFVIVFLTGCLLVATSSETSQGEEPTQSAVVDFGGETTALPSVEPENTAVPLNNLETNIELGPLLRASPTPFPAVMTDTSQQQATFDFFWETVNESYVYPDFNGADWAGLRGQYQARLDAGLSNQAFWQLLEEMLAELNDEHSYLVTVDNTRALQSFRQGGEGLSGIGVSLIGQPEKDSALVAWVIPGSGAWDAGIRNRDRLIAADGFVLCCNFSSDPYPFLLGPSGSTVKVLVQSPGEDPREVDVIRGPLQLNEVIVTDRLAGDIGYIQINSFIGQDTAREFEAAWRELNPNQDLQGLILDLRTNTGGLVIQGDLILRLFTDGPLYYYYDAFVERGREIPRTMGGEDVLGSQTIPMVVLVSEATNSLGEIVAGILHDNQGGRALTIGNRTNANVEILRSYELPDGSLLYLASDSFAPLSGADWERDGVPLDIEIEQLWSEIGEGDPDLALEAAIDYLTAE